MLRAKDRMLCAKMGTGEEEGRRGECSRKWEHYEQSPETGGTMAHSRNSKEARLSGAGKLERQAEARPSRAWKLV